MGGPGPLEQLVCMRRPGFTQRPTSWGLSLPETVGCLDALRRMQHDRQQMAVVISEHGGTEGIITIEDLVEELVGEIWDEADPDVMAVEHHTDGTLTVDGAYPIHDLPDIGVDLPDGEYTTVAGLVMAAMGRVPVTGDAVDVEGWRLDVVEAADRTVRRVLLSPLPRRGPDGRATDPGEPDPDRD